MSADLFVMRGGTGLSDKSTCNAFLPLSLKGSRRERREGAPVVSGGTRGSGGEGRQRGSTPVVSGGRAPVMSDGRAPVVSDGNAEGAAS